MELPYAYIARTTWGPIGLSQYERERHVYIVGKSGSGKSTTLFNLAMHDIVTGQGVAVIDPHGDLAEAVADCIPANRTNAVCYLDAGDAERPVGFNPLANIPSERHALAASGMVSAFKHLWRESWGPRLEHFLFNGIMALLSAPRATLIDLPRVYTDERFRARLVERLRDPICALTHHRRMFVTVALAEGEELSSNILRRIGLAVYSWISCQLMKRFQLSSLASTALASVGWLGSAFGLYWLFLRGS